MPRPNLSATPNTATHALGATADTLLPGTYPGATTYPGGDVLASLIVSGNEITDALRLINMQGDGRTYPDSSFGCWEGTTNLCTQSNPLNAPWTPTANVTKASAALVFVEGGCRLTNITGAGDEYIEFALTGLTANTTYTVSCWLEATAMTTPGNANRSLSVYNFGGSFLTVTLSAAAAKQRVSITFTTGVATTTATIRLQAPNGGSVVYGHVQFEQKAFATPFLPTAGATATRAAARMQAPVNLLNATQGFFAAELRMGFASSGSGVDGYLFEYALNGSNRLIVHYQAGGSRWRFNSIVGGVNNFLDTTDSFAAGDMRTLVIAWGAFGIKISLAGAPFVTSALALPVGMTTLDIGSDQGTGQINSDVMWSVLGSGALNDANAATINAYGNTDPPASLLPASLTGLWYADTANLVGPDVKLYPGRGSDLIQATDSPKTLTATVDN